MGVAFKECVIYETVSDRGLKSAADASAVSPAGAEREGRETDAFTDEFYRRECCQVKEMRTM